MKFSYKTLGEKKVFYRTTAEVRILASNCTIINKQL